jgi:hypothetical protein
MLPLGHAWLARRAKMHADRDDNHIRDDRADRACLRQRLSFADVVKGVNAASKRVPQIDPPTLFFAGVNVLRQYFFARNLKKCLKKMKGWTALSICLIQYTRQIRKSTDFAQTTVLFLLKFLFYSQGTNNDMPVWVVFGLLRSLLGSAESEKNRLTAVLEHNSIIDLPQGI